MGESAVTTERDPVCGKFVSAGDEGPFCSYKGQEYHFCGSECQSAFEKTPNKYLKPKGFIGRFLDRLARSNREQFGDKGPSCCR